MAASTISICNRALLSVGARAQISNLQEGSVESNALSVLFAPTFESLGRAAYWNCLRKQAALTLIKAATGTPENQNGTTLPQPPVPWLYSYSLPSDCLQVRFIVPSLPNSTASGTTPLTTASVTSETVIQFDGEIRYAVAYDTDAQNNPITTILTNQTQAQCVYTVNQPNPVIWDSMFQEAMVASLAAYLVPALSLDLPLMDRAVKSAESIIAQARVRDGVEGVTVMDHLPDWMRARSSTMLYGGAGNNYNVGDYANMCWPGG